LLGDKLLDIVDPEESVGWKWDMILDIVVLVESVGFQWARRKNWL
jgi:hypothetical protein